MPAVHLLFTWSPERVSRAGYGAGMSMSAPLEPELPKTDDGIPAADPGAGAPPPAEGFGIEGEDPDRAEGDPDPEPRAAGDPPFRTPDPREVGRD
ncbi:hypothetical protein [Blastococcus sp. SYSU D00813]